MRSASSAERLSEHRRRGRTGMHHQTSGGTVHASPFPSGHIGFPKCYWAPSGWRVAAVAGGIQRSRPERPTPLDVCYGTGRDRDGARIPTPSGGLLRTKYLYGQGVGPSVPVSAALATTPDPSMSSTPSRITVQPDGWLGIGGRLEPEQPDGRARNGWTTSSELARSKREG